MILTRQQIERIYEAKQAFNGTKQFYLEEDESGKLRFGAIEVVEKRQPIALGKAAK